jgi:hypothetical protein
MSMKPGRKAKVVEVEVVMAAAGAAEAGSPAVGLRASGRENIPKMKKRSPAMQNVFFVKKRKKAYEPSP